LQKLSKKNYNKIGILGGTFDPPHIGHLHISTIALKKLNLDSVIWVIAKRNPLKKKPYLGMNVRIKLSKHIIKNQKKIFIKAKVIIRSKYWQRTYYMKRVKGFY